MVSNNVQRYRKKKMFVQLTYFINTSCLFDNTSDNENYYCTDSVIAYNYVLFNIIMYLLYTLFLLHKNFYIAAQTGCAYFFTFFVLPKIMEIYRFMMTI